MNAKKIIAIETSGQLGSLAALMGAGQEVVIERLVELDSSQRSAQSLAPTLRALLENAAWTPRSIDMVAVAVGPGSFTGLRIGVTTAKTLAYAVGAAIVGVNSLAVIAARAPAGHLPLWTIMDAQRQELFAAKFVADDRGGRKLLGETQIIPRQAWLDKLQSGDHVTGPALARLHSRLPAGVVVVPEERWPPMADAVGQLAWKQFSTGQHDDLWTLLPDYCRPSAAEEKALRRSGPNTH